MQPSNTLLALLCAFSMAFVSCEKKEPTAKNQPVNPATWSPIGHKYVSTDEDHLGREITFLSKDSFLWLRDGKEKVVYYKLEYPTIYVWEELHPWLKFVDTLTISRKSDLADESSKYELVY